MELFHWVSVEAPIADALPQAIVAGFVAIGSGELVACGACRAPRETSNALIVTVGVLGTYAVSAMCAACAEAVEVSTEREKVLHLVARNYLATPLHEAGRKAGEVALHVQRYP